MERTLDPRVRLRRGPPVEERADEIGRLFRVEVADDRELAVRGAEEAGVEFLRLVDGRGLVLGDDSSSVGSYRASSFAYGARRRVIARCAIACGSLFACSRPARFSCRSCSNWSAGNAAAEGPRRGASRPGQVLADGLDRAREPCRDPRDREPRFQLVQLVRELLPGVDRGAAHEHVDREVGAARLPRRLASVADVERQNRHDGLAARLLRQQRELQAAGQRRPLRARLHVRGGRIEDLAGRDRLVPGITLKQRGKPPGA